MKRDQIPLFAAQSGRHAPRSGVVRRHTYVPMERGNAYLCAVMDWHSRKVLGWALSNTMDAALCMEALERALESTGHVPEIFNTDQGSQFTSAGWIGRLEGLGVKISVQSLYFNTSFKIL